jgi:hypothetical protein
LAAYAAHPERFVNGPPRPETLPLEVWINPPSKTTRQDAPGTTIVTPEDAQHGGRSPSRLMLGDRSIAFVNNAGSLQ